jgi:Flp pilus assembly protein TadB
MSERKITFLVFYVPLLIAVIVIWLEWVGMLPTGAGSIALIVFALYWLCWFAVAFLTSKNKNK